MLVGETLDCIWAGGLAGLAGVEDMVVGVVVGMTAVENVSREC